MLYHNILHYPPHQAFFDSESPEHLAKLMGEWWEFLPPGPDLQQEQIAIETANLEVQEFGHRFLEIVRGSI